MNTQHLPEMTIHALEGSYGYLDPLRLFFVHFNRVASVKKLGNIDIQLAREWIEGNLPIKNIHYHCIAGGDGFADESEVRLYILQEPIMVFMVENKVSFIFCEETESKVNALVGTAANWKQVRPSNTIGMVVVNYGQLDTQYLNFRTPKLDLEKQYNADLQPVHKKAVEVLNQDRSGVILFHGEPGTGKSTYVRYLAGLTRKKVIFLTPDLAGNMGSPEIAKFLVQHANAVFVIEDAEQLIASRERTGNSSISTLLNLTDGILGESLGIQIIATFNTELCNIDKALLRKGRMIARYEFKPLSIEKSKALLEELGHDVVPKAPMTLADIYNYEDENYALERVAIGFRV